MALTASTLLRLLLLIIPELSVEPPLLPGSLSLSEAAELKANSDDQLDEGHHS